MMENKLKKTKQFYERKDLIKQVVLARLRQSKNVLTGSRAVNRHLPDYLKKKTTIDYDILVKNGMSPKEAAKKLEQALDKRFKGNYFQTGAGVYPHVQKVTTILTDEEVADFVPMPKPKPKIKTSFDGIRYVGLKYLKNKFKEAIADTEMKFRHKKDLESLKRIQVYEKYHKTPALTKFKVKKIKTQKGVGQRPSTFLTYKSEKGGKLKW